MMSSSLPVPCVNRGPLLYVARTEGKYEYEYRTMSRNGAPGVADA